MEQQLRKSGFEPAVEPGHVRWVKEQRVNTLPHALTYLVDGEVLKEDMFAQTLVGEDWVALSIPSVDYYEGPAALSSDWGKSLLADALAHPHAAGAC